ncbi:MAG TPA: class I SAM-dependent methyltransferase [Bacillales bacterium]|nr:class I SAM-dependent methyltransferase [Bacillales bacterium]
MDIKKYTEANRKAWNEVAPKHEELKREAKKQFIDEPGFSCLDETVTRELAAIGLSGKHVAQLCCNDGVETLSLKNLGAAAVTGFDISDGAIASAQRLAEEAGIESTFVRTDVYEIPKDFDRQFDLIYISAGALIWLPDLPGFFAVAERLLKPGGALLIYEIHPLLNMIDEEAAVPRMKYSYFVKEPQAYNEGLTYLGNDPYEASTAYNFNPTVADIVNAVVSNRFRLRKLEEFPHDLSPMFEHLEACRVRIPMSLLLSAEKD